MNIDMKVGDTNFDGFSGVTAGIQETERWQYPGIGYNATDGIFYIEEDEANILVIVPFALRQCKEVEDAAGMTHRYPIKTRRTDMAEGDITNRLQVVGIVNNELHIFGARSWTARAAWANPLGGPYHDARFAGGLWPRLMAYIKELKAAKGTVTAPLCWELTLAAGDSIDLSSAANPKQKSKGRPIDFKAMRFVGAEKAAEYERLYIDEALGEWVAEWNKTAVTEAATEPEPARAMPVNETEDIPF